MAILWIPKNTNCSICRRYNDKSESMVSDTHAFLIREEDFQRLPFCMDLCEWMLDEGQRRMVKQQTAASFYAGKSKEI